jgi:chromosome partitioning protein
MLIISIINNKGGCGKTTTAINLATGLNKIYNKRVLLIDNDPQGNCASGLGLDPYDTQLFPYSIGDVFQNTNMKLSDAIVKGKFCDLIVNNMYSYEKTRDIQDKVETLKNKIKSEKLKYDFIILDTPPSIDFFTSNAILASNALLIVTELSKYSMQGVQVLLSILESWKTGKNKLVSEHFLNIPKPVLFTMVQSGARITKDVLGVIDEQSPTGLVLSMKIPKTIKVVENAYEGIPSVMKANNPAGKAYKELCETFYFAEKTGVIYGKNYSLSIKK